MALTWAQVSDMAKTEYLPVMIDRITLEDYIMQYVKKFKKVEDVPYEFKKTFRTSFSEGTKMMPDFTAQLANPGQRSYKSMTGTTKWRNGVIKIYVPIAQLMNKDPKSFINELKQEVSGITDAMKAEQERMCWGDGGATQLCTLAADATTSVASPLTLGLAAGSTTKYLRKGMPIDILDGSHVAIANASEIYIEEVIDDSTFTVAVTATGGDLTTLLAAINDGLVYHSGGYLNETHGLGSLLGSATNTVFGINRSTAAGAFYRPKIYKATASGLAAGAAVGTPADWELGDLEQAIKILTIREKATKGDLKIFTTPGIVHYGILLRQTLGEANVAKEKIDLWPYEVPFFNGIPMLDSYYAKDNAMTIADMTGFVKFEAMPLDFDTTDGNMWKWVQNYAAYCAFLLESYELGHYTPWKCMTIGDMKQTYTI